MSTVKKSWMRVVPAVVIPVAVVAGAIAIPAVADAAPKLPEKSAQQVLASIADSADVAYSGTIEQKSDLGLPEIPSTGQASSADASAALEFLTGSHTARIFVGGADTERVQVIDSLAERDVIRNGSDVWLYGSRKNEATHLSLPADQATPSTASPADIAGQLLTSIDPSTTVSVDENARVAGRSAYQVILTPKTDATLVGSVTLAVDAETGLPLRVLVEARGQEAPAVSVGFSDIDFGAPDPALFDFTPPAGAEVTEQSIPTARKSDAAPAAHPEPTVTGEGWGTVVALPATGKTFDSPLLDQLTTSVDGGRAIETSLVSVLLTSDGRVFAGAVTVEALQAAAAG